MELEAKNFPHSWHLYLDCDVPVNFVLEVCSTPRLSSGSEMSEQNEDAGDTGGGDAEDMDRSITSVLSDRRGDECCSTPVLNRK